MRGRKSIEEMCDEISDLAAALTIGSIVAICVGLWIVWLG